MNPTIESKPRRPNQIRKKPSCQVSSPAAQLLLLLLLWPPPPPMPPPPPPCLSPVPISGHPLFVSAQLISGRTVSIVIVYYRGDSKSSSGKGKSGSGGGSRCRGWVAATGKRELGGDGEGRAGWRGRRRLQRWRRRDLGEGGEEKEKGEIRARCLTLFCRF
ncbi:hypothetical protein Drorol1_Dr00021651, partial [Drosera rotundifolia]